MKSGTLTRITAIELFVALAIPVGLAAQNHQQNKQQPRYELIDIGTFGGPDSLVPELQQSRGVWPTGRVSRHLCPSAYRGRHAPDLGGDANRSVPACAESQTGRADGGTPVHHGRWVRRR